MNGKYIQQIRKNKGISLTELANRAGIAKSYLSSIERDIQSNPSIQVLEKLATVLGVSVQTLIHPNTSHEEPLDEEWLGLAKEAMESGISKEEFKDFLEFQKWKKKI